MARWRPLTARGKEGTAFDVLHEGIPTGMRTSVAGWFIGFLRSQTPYGEIHTYTDWIDDLDNRMHLDPPLTMANAEKRVQELLHRLTSGDGTEGLNLLHYALSHLTERMRDQYMRDDCALALERILSNGGSAWQVTDAGDGNYGLTRRAEAIPEAIEEVHSVHDRTGHHLRVAWQALMGREPNPDQAYLHSVQAVEAAARPVVSPNDKGATLGKMLGEIRADSSRWEFVLGSPDQILELGSLLWQGHRRHGTDDATVPFHMTQEEADAGFHAALTLARWFASGAYARA